MESTDNRLYKTLTCVNISKGNTVGSHRIKNRYRFARKRNLVIVFMFLVITFPLPILSQETQVPMDLDGKVDRIDQKTEKKLGLFELYVNFQEARLYQADDSTFALEIIYQPKGKPMRVRLSMSANDANNFRQKITEALREKKLVVMEKSEGGRNKFLETSVGMSLGYYAWIVPYDLRIKDPRLFIGLYGLIGGVGFYLPYKSTQGVQITNAEATMYQWGMTRGALHGFAAAALFLGDAGKARATLAISGISSIGIGAVAYRYARSRPITDGQAEVIGVGGDLGMAAGLLGIVALDVKNTRTQGAMVLGFSGLGIVTGKSFGHNGRYTRGDAYVLFSAGALGALLPMGITDNIKSGHNRSVATAGLTGIVAGAWIGDKLVEKRNFNTNRGLLVLGGTVGGGVTGWGSAMLSTEHHSRGYYTMSSGIGALIGFGAMYASFYGESAAPDKNALLNFNIHYEGLAQYYALRNSGVKTPFSFPLMSLSLNI